MQTKRLDFLANKISIVWMETKEGECLKISKRQHWHWHLLMSPTHCKTSFSVCCPFSAGVDWFCVPFNGFELPRYIVPQFFWHDYFVGRNRPEYSLCSEEYECYKHWNSSTVNVDKNQSLLSIIRHCRMLV